MHYWAILANPNIYDVERALEDFPEDTWPIKNDVAEIGDGIVFWRSIKKGDGQRGIVGLGKVISSPRMMKVPTITHKYFVTQAPKTEDLRIRIKTFKLPVPLWIDKDKSLEELSVANGQGNKLYKVSREQWEHILTIAGGWKEFDSNIFPINSDSWEVLSPNIFIKKIDESGFKAGTGIPIEIRKYFNVEDMSFGEQREVKLIYKDKTFDAQIIMDRQRNPRTQLRWKSDFYKLLQKEFSEFYQTVSNDMKSLIELPEIRFKKNLDYQYTYSIEFIDPSVIERDIRSEDEQDCQSSKEGARKYSISKRYERSGKNRKKAIEIHGLTCVMCGFNFEKFYGIKGKGFIEIHHITPLGSNNKEIIVNPETDLVPVCANCHRMIHRRKDDVLGVKELKAIIKS